MKRKIRIAPGKVILLYPDLVALGIRVSKSTLYRWMNEGKFPASIRLGGTRLSWLSSDIAAWLKVQIEERQTHHRVVDR